MISRQVAINGKFLDATPTGVHRVARELVYALDGVLLNNDVLANRFRIEIVCPPRTKETPSLQSISQRNGGLFTWQFWEQFDLPRLARGETLVNLCNLAPLLSLGGVTLIHDAQVFLSPRSYSFPFAAWYRFALPQIGKRAAKIVTVSEYSRRMLVEYGVASEDRLAVIHNGVDHILRPRAEPQILQTLALARGQYAVALATTQEHKNISVLVRAFSRPCLEQSKLVLVGAATRQDFAAMGISCPPNIIFSGRVSDGELRALYESAGCLAFPSITEGFGLPPLEAMLLGCPVIVAPCGALPEICGSFAAYVPPDDAERWSEAIASFIGAPQERGALLSDAQAHARSFTWRRSAEALLAVLTDVVQPHPHSG